MPTERKQEGEARVFGEESLEKRLIKSWSHTLYDLAGNFNVFLTSHENQDIARWKRQMDLKDLFDSTIDVVFAR